MIDERLKEARPSCKSWRNGYVRHSMLPLLAAATEKAAGTTGSPKSKIEKLEVKDRKELNEHQHKSFDVRH